MLSKLERGAGFDSLSGRLRGEVESGSGPARFSGDRSVDESKKGFLKTVWEVPFLDTGAKLIVAQVDTFRVEQKVATLTEDTALICLTSLTEDTLIDTLPEQHECRMHRDDGSQGQGLVRCHQRAKYTRARGKTADSERPFRSWTSMSTEIGAKQKPSGR